MPPGISNPTANLPRTGQVVAMGRFAVTIATPESLIAAEGEPLTVRRTDPETFADMGDVDMQSTGGFPPDGQTMVQGSNGIWITLGAQHAVALIDPESGEVVRRIEVDGAPYSMIEQGDDLWIVDLEAAAILRVDRRNGREIARVAVRHPVAIAYSGGSIWAVENEGRHEPSESLGIPPGVLHQIDPATNEEVAQLKVGHRPLFATSWRDTVWVSNATSGTVSGIDALTGEVTNIPIGDDGAFDIEATVRGIFVVIGPQWGSTCDPENSYFVRIDPDTLKATHRIDFPCPSSITSDLGYGLWVTGSDDQGVVSGLIRNIDT